MTQRLGWNMAVLSGLMLALGSVVWARAKNDQDFPDYNHLEYAKPMPAADEQVQQPPPGSIHMEVGGKKSGDQNMPLEELPVSIRPTQNRDNGEPPLDFFDSGTPVPAPAPVVSSATSPAVPAAENPATSSTTTPVDVSTNTPAPPAAP